MLNNFGLDEYTIEKILKVFRQHPKVKSARIFGSRAKGNFKPNSDIDLVVYGLDDEMELGLLALSLDELMVPYKFDIKAYEFLNHDELKAHIDRVSQSLYFS